MNVFLKLYMWGRLFHCLSKLILTQSIHKAVASVSWVQFPEKCLAPTVSNRQCFLHEWISKCLWPLEQESRVCFPWTDGIGILVTLSTSYWKVAEYATPNICHFGRWITLSWRQLRWSRNKKSSVPSPICLSAGHKFVSISPHSSFPQEAEVSPQR